MIAAIVLLQDFYAEQPVPVLYLEKCGVASDARIVGSWKLVGMTLAVENSDMSMVNVDMRRMLVGNIGWQIAGGGILRL